MLAQDVALAVYDGAGGVGQGVLPQEVTIVPAHDEADVLALGRLGGGQARLAGQLPHLGLRVLPHRQQHVGQRRLVEVAQGVGLILLGVATGEQTV